MVWLRRGSLDPCDPPLDPPLQYNIVCETGVYKQWTGLLEWWNTGMVDWIVFNFYF